VKPPGRIGKAMILFKDSYRGKKVLVTGNTGFKGSWLSVWLHQLGAEVFGLSNAVPTNPAMFEVLNLSEIVTHHVADVRDLATVKQIIQRIKPDYLFHLAAQPIVATSYTDPVGTISTNALGTVHVLEAVRDLTHKCQVVLITSDKCYENVEWLYGYRETDRLGGKDIYSASKAAAEILIYSYYHSFLKHNSNIRLASVRAGNVIGGGDWAEKRLVPDCVRAWAEGKPVVIRNPASTRPWQHVLEPLSGYLIAGHRLAENETLNGEPFNFGPPSDQVFSVEQILSAIGKHWQFSSGHEKVKVEGAPFHEAGLLKLSCEKANTLLAWWPVLDFEQTAQFTASWYSRFYQRTTDMKAFTVQQINEYNALAASKQLAWTR